MEHGVLQEWEEGRGVILDADKRIRLIQYAELIHSTNQRFNLTGFKNIHDILLNLIIGSIEPFISINVPRGTLFADIGTGAGIPGIPLAIYHDTWNGILIDSNTKKVSFVNSVIRECMIDNLDVYNGRLENLAREQMRDRFDYVFSRALGEIFFVIEVGAPLLKVGGLMYIYSHTDPEDLPVPVCTHIQQLGLSLLDRAEYDDYGIKETGILLCKTGVTESRYPRNITVINRDIKRKIKASYTQ